MSANIPYTYYSPALARDQNTPTISARDLKEKLKNFYMVFKPSNAREDQLEQYLKYARDNGVFALNNILRMKYNATMDEIDNTDAGWASTFRHLELFYKAHAPGKQIDIHRIFQFARDKGILELDKELEQKYGQSFSQFLAKDLHKWQRNWKSVLQEYHQEAMEYELKRFYAFVETIPGGTAPGSKREPIEKLVAYAVKAKRSEVNEKLLKKYKFCLDDVKMVKGTTTEEKRINLKAQLVEFYQRNDPARLGDTAAAGSNDNSYVGDSLNPSARYSAASGNSRNNNNTNHQWEQAMGTANVASAEMLRLEAEVDLGLYRLEELEQKLMQKYGKGLEDTLTKEIRNRLFEFYAEVNDQKTPDQIEKVVEYALKKGAQAMNDKLILTYGKSIRIDDL